MTTPEYPRYPSDEEFTDEEVEIVKTALSILPHLGPEATAAYLERATETHTRGAHEGA